MMKIPEATYRIQFCPSFTFADADQIIPYLHDLGITDVYASPVLRSRKGSAHGYDMTDPCSFDPELGGKEGFERLTATVAAHTMGWLQDIVPNHMAYHHENSRLMDVLEKGKHSQFSGFFDILWDFPEEQLRGKLMAPFLGENLDWCLRKGEITIGLDRSGFYAVYYDHRFPLSISSYEQILSTVIGVLEKRVGLKNADVGKLKKCLHSVRTYTDECPASAVSAPCTGQGPSGSESTSSIVKRLLWDLYSKSRAFRSSLSEALGRFDPEQMRELLGKQHYRLYHWKSALRMINYRRFFDISDLIAVCVEKKEVFDAMHALVIDSVKSGHISGLRIDHIDGLLDPKEYLIRLRKRALETLIFVEKILEPGELLPDSWPVQGTTGYDFLNLLNGIFCRRGSERQLTSLYRELTGISASCELIRYRNKKMVAKRYLAGDVQNLISCAETLTVTCGMPLTFSRDELSEALITLLAAFPVYRTYVDPTGCSDSDREYLKEAFAAAEKTEQRNTRALDFLRKIFFREEESAIRKEALPFLMRFQQLSGPLMAKGMEDTTLYTYNRFVALNEVGADPGRVGISLKDFHQINEERQSEWPHAMNASSTHDTKRGEDARARLNVLTEITGEWRRRVKRWVRINAPMKTLIHGKRVPDQNDEYFLYQALLGAYPFSPGEQARFLERLKYYTVKALRESKRNSSWTQPQLEYEKACEDFLKRILSPCGQNAFLTDFLPFQKRVSRYGIWNSLSQTLIKLTAPGIPDIYQGSELWNFSFVDPDNRQAVDYAKRMSYLREIMRREETTSVYPVADLLKRPEDGSIKQFVIRRVLRVRNKEPDLFLNGRYIPIQSKGKFFDHVVSFARVRAGRWVVAVAPRFLTYLISEEQIPVGKTVWKNTCVILPEPAPSIWTEELTGMRIQSAQRLELGTVFASFPLALLKGG